MEWVERFFDGPFYARDYESVAEDEQRTAREVDFLRQMLEFQPDHVVLDLACGSGRHAFTIAGLVKKVYAVDRTASFIEEGRRQAIDRGIENIEFAVGDMRKLDSRGEFDAAYNYFTAWGYYDDETNLDVLRRVCRALKPGGRFLLEILNRDAVMAKFQPRDWRRLDDGTYVLYDRHFDFATGRNHSQYIQLKDGNEEIIEIDHYIPTSDALIRLFDQAGFSETRVVSAADGGELQRDSWRMAAIGRKQ